MGLLRRLLPESIFARKLSAEAEQRLRLAQARADEAIVRAHVSNALLFVDALAPDVAFERALDIYVREMGLAEPVASVVLTRALVALGEGLVPEREPVPRVLDGPQPAEAVSADEDWLPRPRIRLDEAGAARQQRRAV